MAATSGQTQSAAVILQASGCFRRNVIMRDIVDAKDRFGRTPLHVACYNGREGVADLLIQAGADLQARDHDGRTPLDAVAYGQEHGPDDHGDYGHCRKLLEDDDKAHFSEAERIVGQRRRKKCVFHEINRPPARPRFKARKEPEEINKDKAYAETFKDLKDPRGERSPLEFLMAHPNSNSMFKFLKDPEPEPDADGDDTSATVADDDDEKSRVPEEEIRPANEIDDILNKYQWPDEEDD